MAKNILIITKVSKFLAKSGHTALGVRGILE